MYQLGFFHKLNKNMLKIIPELSKVWSHYPPLHWSVAWFLHRSPHESYSSDKYQKNVLTWFLPKIELEYAQKPIWVVRSLNTYPYLHCSAALFSHHSPYESYNSESVHYTFTYFQIQKKLFFISDRSLCRLCLSSCADG